MKNKKKKKKIKNKRKKMSFVSSSSNLNNNNNQEISSSDEKKLIYGIRDENFKDFLLELLQNTSLPYTSCQFLLSQKNVYEMYESVFTHRTFDINNCYEYYELIGDVLANHIIIYYLKERFPFLKNIEGVKTLSRLKINLVSKVFFSKWAKDLDFEKYISYDEETKLKQNTSVLEDVFEAFLGATQTAIDKHIRGFSGYYMCYIFLKTILDKEKISLSYNELFDPITRLKECCDYYNSTLLKGTCPYIYGNISFNHEKIESGKYKVDLIQSSSSKKEILLTSVGHSIINLKYKLCEEYLLFLKERGYEKKQPEYYDKIEMMRIESEA